MCLCSFEQKCVDSWRTQEQLTGLFPDLVTALLPRCVALLEFVALFHIYKYIPLFAAVVLLVSAPC